MATEIQGTCDARFARVKDVFAGHVDAGLELGASVAVVLDGKPVVDLWAGLADRKSETPWKEDTLVNVFSVTKALSAICVLRLVDEGRVDLDRPVAEVWPEFAAGEKGAITLRQILSHQAGLPAVREVLPPEALFDWNLMSSALAAESPWWPPGTQHGYHAVTFGWLVGEIVRRVSGRSLGTYFREEIAGPLDLDAHIGFGEEHDARCARLQSTPLKPGQETFATKLMTRPHSMAARAFANPVSLAFAGTVVSRAWRGAEIPSANGHATARSLAKLFGALAAGGSAGNVRVLSPEMIARAAEQQVQGVDAILEVETRFGLGFMLPQAHDPFGRAGSFGHPGLGGSLGFADPGARIGFGYTMNRLGTTILVDPRPQALADAVYASL